MDFDKWHGKLLYALYIFGLLMAVPWLFKWGNIYMAWVYGK